MVRLLVDTFGSRFMEVHHNPAILPAIVNFFKRHDKTTYQQVSPSSGQVRVMALQSHPTDANLLGESFTGPAGRQPNDRTCQKRAIFPKYFLVMLISCNFGRFVGGRSLELRSTPSHLIIVREVYCILWQLSGSDLQRILKRGICDLGSRNTPLHDKRSHSCPNLVRTGGGDGLTIGRETGLKTRKGKRASKRGYVPSIVTDLLSHFRRCSPLSHRLVLDRSTVPPVRCSEKTT
ncbi:hypothetical protein EDB87DRAFT_208010 [Lactarius vividus]|nr:hypothetical protein EDB87DRAFT_208010 [Lactarius vividus]